MTAASDAPSKTHRNENFPVASLLIAPRHRETVLAYYRFARGADDVVDSPTLNPDEKLAGLDRFEATLLGKDDAEPAARPLRAALAATGLKPRHALDLLTAFRMDATKLRYANWDELMHYCAYSAAPVGRFVLDVHGESEASWPASDALCSGLQVINHIQDCAADFRNLDRVYVPQDLLAKHGTDIEALKDAKASPALRACLLELTQKTSALVETGTTLPSYVSDLRLRLETAVIGRLARTLTQRLMTHDPLSEKVHLGKPAFIGWSLLGMLDGLFSRRARMPAPESRRA